MSSTRIRISLAGAAAGVAALISIWWAVSHIGFLARADQSALRGFVGLSLHPQLNSLAERVARLCDPKPFAVIGTGAVLIAMGRRRPWLALGVGTLLAGSTLSTELMKPLLAAPHPTGLPEQENLLPPGSWPSGHATAAMALAMAYCIAVPSRARPAVAALGAAFAVAVPYAFLTLEWHYPSDVFAGYLVAWVWTMLAVAAVTRLERRPPSGAAARLSLRAEMAPAVVALMLAGMCVLVVLIARPAGVLAYARAHHAFVLSGLAIGVASLTLATALSHLSRR